jgi:hypothetical protein
MQSNNIVFNTEYVKEICKEKLVNDFMYLRQNADDKLSKFLDYLRYCNKPTYS